MLSDFNSFFRSGLEWFLPVNFTDNDFSEALKNCYEAICFNKYQSGKLLCPLNLDDVGAVIISYIAYFTMAENKDAKYYYDEYSDRKDPYRKGLIALITKGAREYSNKITEDFCNEVLSYLYWSIKRKKCPKVILRPKEVTKFNVKNWYINEPYRSIIAMKESTYNAIIKVFKASMKAVEVAGEPPVVFRTRFLRVLLGGAFLKICKNTKLFLINYRK
jgi:hypothetical protein